MKILDRDYFISARSIGSFLATGVILFVGSYWLPILSIAAVLVGYVLLQGFFTGFANGVIKAISKTKSDV